MIKRERKPWYRLRNIGLFVGAFSVTVVGYVFYRGATAVPGTAIDYSGKLAEYAATLQPDPAAPNQWAMVEEMLEIHEGACRDVGGRNADGTPREIDFVSIYSEAMREEPAATDTPEIVAHIEDGNKERASQHEQERERAKQAISLMKERGVIERMAKLSSVSHAVRPIHQGRLVERLSLDLSKFRSLARANAARMELAVRVDDADEYVAAVEQSLAMGRVVSAQGYVIDRLVACAIDALALRRVQSHIMAGELDAATCRRLLEGIDRLDRRPVAGAMMEGERLMFLDMVQATHSDDGNGDGIYLPSSSPGIGQSVAGPLSALGNSLWVIFPTKAKMTARGNAFYDEAVKYVNATIGERTKLANPERMVENLPKTYELLSIMMPAVGKAAQSVDQSRMETSATRVMLAIRIFELEHSRIPDSLDELAPGILKSLPTDPLAPDGKLRYKKLPAPDELGRRYLVYSVGRNGVDDGGTPGAKSRYDAFASGSKCDYIVNSPDDPPR